MPGFQAMSKRMIFVYFLIVAVFAYVVYVLHDVQITRHDYLLKKARGKYSTKKINRGKRGEICDYSGNLLVGNIPCSNVCADPSMTESDEKCREIARFLAPKLQVPENEIFRKLTARYYETPGKDGTMVRHTRKFVVLKPKVDFELSETLRTEVEKRKWKCIFFQEDIKRYYPKGRMLANILGFTSVQDGNIIPLDGLEKNFNSSMKSVNGTTSFLRDRKGRPLDYGDRIVHEEQNGNNLYLTIREPLQAIVEDEIDKIVAEYSPRGVYIVMADPWTGEILAVAQRPTFNPNQRAGASPQALRCSIAEDAMDPGSVMKPVIVACALDQGFVRPDTRFDCEKGKWLYGKRILHDSHPLGVLTVSEIIQHSSNIGTAKIALRMGDKNVDEALRKFGFGSRTGIPIKGEVPGIFPKLKNWNVLTITRICMGQGITVTPFQMIRAYCALANGGYPVKLKLVDRIENPETGAVTKFPNVYGKRIFRRKETSHEILEMLKSVTGREGTARKAAVKGYYVAGKTGTAQKVEPGAEYIDAQGRKRRRPGKYSKTKYVANFIGFVPADHPRFVMIITVDEPKTKNYYGGAVSGPYFRSISERSLRYLDVKPDYDWEAREAAEKAARKAEWLRKKQTSKR